MADVTFVEQISKRTRIIGFEPMSDEPAYDDYLQKLGLQIPEDRIPADASKDPFETALHFVGLYKGESVALYIPGRQFDMQGTRHGRGHGWYDRFLSKVPRTWYRVGVLNADALSGDVLTRKPWDEPMDALLIFEDGKWRSVIV